MGEKGRESRQSLRQCLSSGTSPGLALGARKSATTTTDEAKLEKKRGGRRRRTGNTQQRSTLVSARIKQSGRAPPAWRPSELSVQAALRFVSSAGARLSST